MMRARPTRRVLAGLLALALCVWALAAGAAPASQEQWVRVAFVNDGDTITVYMQGRRELVRLLGVDAPETARSKKLERAAARAGRTPQAEAELGESARRAVMELLPKGSLARLEQDPGAGDRDALGRLLAYVYLEDGRLLNTWLAEQGYAQAYYHCNCRLRARILELRDQARRERRGLWALGGP